jgi:hypothetical protein
MSSNAASEACGMAWWRQHTQRRTGLPAPTKRRIAAERGAHQTMAAPRVVHSPAAATSPKATPTLPWATMLLEI